jgi:methyl-accepting chemotaxis protein
VKSALQLRRHTSGGLVKKLGIGLRLTAGFVVVLAFLAGVGLLGLGRLAQLNEVVDVLARVRWVKAQKAGEASSLSANNALAVTRMFLETDAAAVRRLDSEIEETRRKITALIDEIDRTELDEGGKRLIQAVRAERNKFVDAFEAAKTDLRSGEHDKALAAANGRMVPLLLSVQKAWDAYVAHQQALLDEARNEKDELYASGRSITIALMVAALAIAAVIAFYVTRSITTPVLATVGVADRIARGDLRDSVEITSRDEIGQLQASMRAMAEKLAEVIGEVRGGAVAET